MKNIINRKRAVTGAIAAVLFVSSCQKAIDLDPISNVGAEAYYRNYNEVNSALTGCYHGLHEPLLREWMFTELRSDNSKQGVPNSSAVANLELNTLDMFAINPFHERIYDYWLSNYTNIRAINYVLRSLGVTYENGQTVVGEGIAELRDDQKSKAVGEALFLRAYHYFNLVRLYGSVFLITEPVNPQTAKQQTRSSVQDLYDFIVADLARANEVFSSVPYSAIPASELGHANIWASKSLLAKVYLTLNQPTNALPLLDDVIANSGYALLDSYADVFSISNEMNREIIFAVRYKAGGFGLGSPFANHFAPLASGNAVVNNGGRGLNFPTEEMKTIYKAGDARRDATVVQFNPNVPYVKKFVSQVVLVDDAENDFPVIRFSDVLLMKAEALGFDGPSGVSVDLVNRVRERAGATDYGTNTDFATHFYKYPATGTYAVTDDGSFRTALFNERRIELAFENQRYFDIMRAGNAVEVIRNHFAEEFAVHYSRLQEPTTLEQLQARVTPERLLLPIPQRERDTNDQIDIGQNPGY